MPAKTTISRFHWDTIIDRIHEGFCVPFLGAGVNVSGDGYQGLPLGSEVAMRLFERLAEPKDLADLEGHQYLKLPGHRKDLARVALQNLPRVALHVEFEARGDYDRFIDTLMDIIPDTECEPSPLLKTLAGLPFGLIVTTNYDRLMERALEAKNKPYKLVVQPIKGFEATDQKALRDELAQDTGLIVYKIHGTFLEKESDANKPDRSASSRIIITEEDYIEFLLTVGGIGDIENLAVPKLIVERMVYSTLLFLGYGLEDWDFRAIFKGLIERLPPHTQRISFAIQKNPSDFWVDFWDRKKVVIYDVDLHEFTRELEQRYQAKYGINPGADGGKG